MADRMLYRGPDAGGTWADPDFGLGFGHRRLSIVDLTEAGSQPMVSNCGRYVICYNGEVYNAGQLRNELVREGIDFRGTSDTEAILEGCAKWGIEPTSRRMIGMFVFALWDRKDRTCHLVRDRLGIKPLFWQQSGQLITFASELKGLAAHPSWKPEIDNDSVAAYLRFGYVPAPRCIYRGVRKVRPGTILTIRQGVEPRESVYWSLEKVVAAAKKNKYRGSEAEAEEELTALIRDSVGMRMIADVPLGAFLSGGIDSSTVVALMQEQSMNPIKTFSIGFNESTYDEAPFAKSVAKHLGTDHHELYVTPKEARDVIPLLPEMYDEPLSDSSQIATYLVSRLAREHLTVALSGDGGDEVFCGYGRYFHARNLMKYPTSVPQFLRHGASHILRAMPDAFFRGVEAVVPSSLRPNRFSHRIRQVADLLAADEDKIYLSMMSLWHEPENLVPGAVEPPNLHLDQHVHSVVPDFTERMQYIDTLAYLPNDILTKVDRASMAVSLEARVPLLDHRIVEFAWRLPSSFRVRDGGGKWILRQVLGRYVPSELFERPKMGFGVPIGDWLNGPLREWGENLLSVEALTSRGLFNPEPIRAIWEKHQNTQEDWQYPLWTVLSLQAWLEHNS